jgi:hypothetical protein
MNLNHTLSLSCPNAERSYSPIPPLYDDIPHSMSLLYDDNHFVLMFSLFFYLNIAPQVKQGDLCAVHIVPTGYRPGPDMCEVFRKWWGWKDLWRAGYTSHSQLMLCLWFCHEFSWSWFSGFWIQHLGFFDQYEKIQSGAPLPVNDNIIAELEKMRKYFVNYFLRYQLETPFLATPTG